jgi:uncharacterized membrane protein YccC
MKDRALPPALHGVRAAAQVAMVRPAYAAGLRAGIATISPLILDQLAHTGGGSWMSLAGLNGAISDRGGPYRHRAATMTALAIASAFAAVLGTVLAGHLAASVVATFLLAVLCGLLRAWPDVGPGFGVTVLVTFAIALAVPSHTLSATLMRGVFIVLGGLWAMLLSVVLWPLRPYRPVRVRVATCYQTLADYLETVANERAARPAHERWGLNQYRVAMRAALESARAALGTHRRGRVSETGRGERLLVLHEVADQMFAHLVALLDVVEGMPQTADGARARDAVAAVLAGIAATSQDVARSVESEADRPMAAVGWSSADLRALAGELRNAAGDSPLGPQLEQAAELVDRMRDYARLAVGVASTLSSGAPIAVPADALDVQDPPSQPIFFSIGALLRPDSIVLQHALRVGIVTATAVLMTGLLGLNHGYWTTLTAVVILQPYTGATTTKAFQRVAGTVLGGIVAAGLSAFFHSSIAVLALVFIFTVACVTILPLNYGAYAVLGTPAFVLLAEASAGDWHLAGLRIINTLIGGALALIGARVLWPTGDMSRLPEFAASAVRALDDYLRLALSMAASGESDPGALRNARRAVALAASNAEESFQRLLAERRRSAETLEAVMAFLVYTRRMSSSLAAVALAATPGTTPPPGTLDQFQRAADSVLADLAHALLAGRPPSAFPAPGSVAVPETAPAALRLQLVRIARQLKTIHDAVARWIDPSDSREPLVYTREMEAQRAAR